MKMKSPRSSARRNLARHVTLAVLMGLASGPVELIHAQQTNLRPQAERRTGRSPASPATNNALRRVKVSPKLPPYRLVLKPDPATDDSSPGPRHIGRIEVFKGDSKVVLQRIEVEGSHPDWLASSFHTLDVNFDGYLDFAVVYEVGGKYSCDSYWLFDPGSGRFITNALTAELRNLTHNSLTLDPRKQEIRTTHFIGVCLDSFIIYRVENGHLLLLESEMHSPREPGRCLVEKRRRVNGEITLIEAKERTHEIPPSFRER